MATQLVPTMTLQHDDWTHSGVAFTFRCEADYSYADSIHTANEFNDIIERRLKEIPVLVGWTFKVFSGTFTGPANPDALQAVAALIVEAIDSLTVDEVNGPR